MKDLTGETLVRGLSHKVLDKLKIKKTKNFFGKVYLFYRKQSPLASIHHFAWSKSELKEIFINAFLLQ